MDELKRQELIQREMEKMKRIMAVKRIDLNAIWFASVEHAENFKTLIKRFVGDRNNPEYASAIYICAHPEIHRKIDWSKPMERPTDWYWGKWVGKDEDDDAGYHEESEIIGWLSSAYRSLARAAIELFTSRKHHFDLMQFIGNAGDEVYRLYIQMLEIRRDRYIIDLWSEQAKSSARDES